MESPDNIIVLCGDCSKERREEWQRNNPKTIIAPGDYVKAGFTDKGHTEHMWVKVTAIRNREIIGILDNDPIVVTRPKLGDHVKVQRSEVEDLLRKTKGTVH